MRRSRRNREGSLFFFTLTTHQRRGILTTESGRSACRVHRDLNVTHISTRRSCQFDNRSGEFSGESAGFLLRHATCQRGS